MQNMTDLNNLQQPSKKKIFKNIRLLVLIPILAIGFIASTILWIWIGNFSSNSAKRWIQKSGESSDINIDTNVTDHYYQKLDSESQKFISNNVYQIRFTSPTKQIYTTMNAFGTASSIYHDDNAWYLMTNYHVVSSIIEQIEWNLPDVSDEDPSSYNKVTYLKETPFLTRNQIQYGLKSELGKGVPTIPYVPANNNTTPDEINLGIRPGLSLVSVKLNAAQTASQDKYLFNSFFHTKKISIFYDRFCQKQNPTFFVEDTNDKNYFAQIDQINKNRYQVDMAVIKIRYDDIDYASVPGHNPAQFTLETTKNWIINNTNNIASILPDYTTPTSLLQSNNGMNSFSYYTDGNSNHLQSNDTPPNYYYVSGFPVRETHGIATAYFDDYAFIESNKSIYGGFKNSSTIVANNWSTDPKDWVPTSISNRWTISKNPFALNYTPENQLWWPLTPGASGSPLWRIKQSPTENYKYTIASHIPDAIFWGGTLFSKNTGGNNDLFQPSFQLFASDINSTDRNNENNSTLVERSFWREKINYSVKYNIWENIINKNSCTINFN